MRVLVTGAAGLLGSAVMRELECRGHQALGSGRQLGLTMDITDAGAVWQVITGAKPDAVIHCAAWAAVDAAEAPENQSRVWAVNAGGTANVAAACKALSCKLVYLSTDYVFGGEGNTPWDPDCRDFAPLNVYGQTKLEGEQAVRLLEKYFIVRTAWVFGPGGGNFVRTMLDAGKRHDRVRVVADQIGTPTYAPDLARLLVDMAESEHYGCYHATNEGGYISWYDFAREIFRQAGYPVRVEPVTTAEYGACGAKRPKNSRLNKEKLARSGFTPLPAWDDALSRYLKETEV